ncbi:hypothetical protein GCM10023187_52410 [Nibrella viscosa]|uniref:DUF3408 domain-containing protein n=1 Tax=Nibrella viscosa TaxID=1084524 RepID=A0ABP8KZJ9_9BACT
MAKNKAADDITTMVSRGIGSGSIRDYLSSIKKEEPVAAPAETVQPESQPAPIIVKKGEETPKNTEDKKAPADTQASAAPESHAYTLDEKEKKKLDKYAQTFLKKNPRFVRSSKQIAISKNTHALITLLVRYADQTGNKVSIMEVLENIVENHIRENETNLKAIKEELIQLEFKI